MAPILWTIAFGAFALLASGLCLMISEGDSTEVERDLAGACCLAALGLCVGSFSLHHV